jgi:hypothetical protein
VSSAPQNPTYIRTHRCVIVSVTYTVSAAILEVLRRAKDLERPSDNLLLGQLTDYSKSNRTDTVRDREAELLTSIYPTLFSGGPSPKSFLQDVDAVISSSASAWKEFCQEYRRSVGDDGSVLDTSTESDSSNQTGFSDVSLRVHTGAATIDFAMVGATNAYLGANPSRAVGNDSLWQPGNAEPPTDDPLLDAEPAPELLLEDQPGNDGPPTDDPLLDAEPAPELLLEDQPGNDGPPIDDPPLDPAEAIQAPQIPAPASLEPVPVHQDPPMAQPSKCCFIL